MENSAEHTKEPVATNASIHPAVDVELREDEKKAYVTIKKADSYPTCDEVIDALRRRANPYWVDEAAIQRALDAGILDKSFTAAYATNGVMEIKMEEYERAAYLTLKPAYGGEDLTLEDAQKHIQDAGIVFGINYGTVRSVFSDKVYNTPVLFAKGKEPVHGLDARIDYTFPLDFKISPKALEHDKVDYKELQMIYTVSTGEVLARKTPATKGEPGCTITGKTIQAKPGDDKKLTAGRGASLAGDGLSAVAAMDGQPILKGNAVFVEPVFVVRENVDYSVGNINFKGSVKVLGSVISGFSVKATDNIEVDGIVEDCSLEAGRDISIKGGVLGANKGSIKAGRDIHMYFVENCYVEAGRNVIVGDALNSNISAGDAIDAILGKGRVFGGSLSARNLITSNILGSGASNRTQITVGYEPKTVAKLKNLRNVLSKVKYTYEEISKHIAALEELKRTGPLDREKEIHYMRLVATEEELRHNTEELEGEINMLETTLVKSAKPMIKIRKTCHPNVRIRIGRYVFDCCEEYNSAVFYEEEEKIKVNVYESFV
ncbi:MAG TPA: FapA family protein [Syntrophorhabdaceae bacterium]|nr:FapA family protein [Syntrophorhabdaceae bacterium]